MIIGVPKEIKLQEHRIGLTPESVKTLANKNNAYESIFIDKDGYGGLNLAIEIARGLLENSSFSGDVLDHPDLYFSFPSFASLKESDNVYNDWLDFVKQHPFSDFQKWSNRR